jgi:hypothetical protein
VQVFVYSKYIRTKFSPVMMQKHVRSQKIESFGTKSPGVLRNKSTYAPVLTLGTNVNTDVAQVPVPYRSGAFFFLLSRPLRIKENLAGTSGRST